MDKKLKKFFFTAMIVNNLKVIFSHEINYSKKILNKIFFLTVLLCGLSQAFILLLMASLVTYAAWFLGSLQLGFLVMSGITLVFILIVMFSLKYQCRRFRIMQFISQFIKERLWHSA